MTLRIAYLTGEYPRATDTFIQREVAALRSLGLAVETCSIRRTGAEHHVGQEQQTEAANTFHVLEAARRPLHLVSTHFQYLARHPRRYLRTLALALRTSPGGLRPLVYQLFYFAEAAVLARRLGDTGAQHLHNHIAKSSCTVAMLASSLSGIPFSFTLHGPDIFFEPVHWRLDEKIKRARFVACISEFCRSQAMAFSPPEDWTKLHIVHCGVDPARYARPVDSAADTVPDPDPGPLATTPEAPDQVQGTAPRPTARLLFVGRLAAVKGLPVLFDALARIETPLALAIVGDGPDRTTLKARAASLPHPVEFLGYRSQADVAALLRQADLFVLPSFAEGLPVVLMEALAAEIPVIATQIAGIPELVTPGETGRLVPPGDAQGLAQVIEPVLQDPEKARQMARAGRARVAAEFDSTTEAARLAHLFAAYAANPGDDRPAKRPPGISPEPAP